MKILGISAYYHDSAATLLIDGKPIAAAHEERFSRKKHDASFPVKAIEYVLSEAGISISDLDSIAFYDKPYIKFERLLESYHAFAPLGLKSFLLSMPVWIKEKLFMRRNIIQELKLISDSDRNNKKSFKKPHLRFPEHHLSHAASAFFPSPFEEAAILTIDGVGEWATTTICYGQNNKIIKYRELSFPHSLGLLYSAFTAYCGFKVNSGEYKLMGLAPYGQHNKEQLRYKQLILENLVNLKKDGSMFLNMDFFDYAVGLKMFKPKKWEQLFNLPERPLESDISQPYMDLALALQEITEEAVMRLAVTAKSITNSDNLTMAGGVALNCVANGKLVKSGIFKNIWIQPAAGDAGGAMGAAYATHHIFYNSKRIVSKKYPDMMKGSYLGPQFKNSKIEALKYKFNANYKKYDTFDLLSKDTAQLIADDKVVGWFQGRLEWGPRALGNRSILADPRNPETQKKLNLKIKYREGFRPFAPSVLAEEMQNYFDLQVASPYMLMVAPVDKSLQKEEPAGYSTFDLYKRLYHTRSIIPAVTHVDYSARIQTVHKETNNRYWTLINEFKKITGIGLLVNTSFNVRGEPIVCTPEDAYRCFMRTQMDLLVIGNYMFFKQEQPGFSDTISTSSIDDSWKEEFELD